MITISTKWYSFFINVRNSKFSFNSIRIRSYDAPIIIWVKSWKKKKCVKPFIRDRLLFSSAVNHMYFASIVLHNSFIVRYSKFFCSKILTVSFISFKFYGEICHRVILSSCEIISFKNHLKMSTMWHLSDVISYMDFKIFVNNFDLLEFPLDQMQ